MKGRLIFLAPKIHLGECIKYINPRWPSWIARTDNIHPVVKRGKNYSYLKRPIPRSIVTKTDEEILTRTYSDIWTVGGKAIYHIGIPYIPISRSARIGFKDRFRYWYIWPRNKHLFHWECQCPLKDNTDIDSYIESCLENIKRATSEEITYVDDPIFTGPF